MQTSVTCLITCYNEKEFVGAAIASVQAQNRADLIQEIIVVNDGSTDGSAAILDALADRDSRLRVFHIANRGLSGARNFGLAQVSAPFVALLDGDDLWHREKLARQWEFVEKSSRHVALWYSDYVDFSARPDNGLVIPVRAYHGTGENPLRAYFTVDAPIVPSTVVLRMAALKETGFFDETIRLFEDMDMWLRIAAAGYSFQHVAGGLTYKRARAGSLSSNAHRWEKAFTDIGARWAEQRPELRPALKARQSYRLSKIAQQHFLAGTDAEGWPYFWRALKENPKNARLYLYGAMALVPHVLRKRLTRALKLARGRRLESPAQGLPS